MTACCAIQDNDFGSSAAAIASGNVTGGGSIGNDASRASSVAAAGFLPDAPVRRVADFRLVVTFFLPVAFFATLFFLPAVFFLAGFLPVELLPAAVDFLLLVVCFSGVSPADTACFGRLLLPDFDFVSLLPDFCATAFIRYNSLYTSKFTGHPGIIPKSGGVFNQYKIEDWASGRKAGYDSDRRITHMCSADYNCLMHRLRTFLAACLLAPVLLLVSVWGNAAVLPFVEDNSPGDRQAGPTPGMFLVSARKLRDRHFRESVIYILRHNNHGTLGLIINKPGTLPLSRALDNVDAEHARHHRLYFGGPVETSAIIMLMKNIPESPLVEHITGDIYFSNQRIVMERLLQEKKSASKLHFFHGHAGWTTGQLEQELSRGDWHLIDGNPRSVFSSEIKTLWHRLIRKLEPLGIIVRAAGQPAPRSN